MIKPGHQKYCKITHKSNIYTFDNLRDFTRTNESQDQIPNWTKQSFDINKLSGLDLYISPFALYDMIGHTILSFNFGDDTQLLISIEGQQNINEDYSIWKAIYPGYRSIYIRGTYDDIIGLRILRKEKIFKYKINISPQNTKTLLINLTKTSNQTNTKYKKHGLLYNNCTSSIRMIAQQYFNLPRRHIGIIFNKFLPKMLLKLKLINSTKGKEIKKL